MQSGECGASGRENAGVAGESMGDRDRKRGMRLVYFGQGVGPLMSQLFMRSAFGVLFIKRLGGSDFQAMLVAPLLMLARALQVPTSLIVPPRIGKRFMLRCWAIGAGFLVLALGATAVLSAPGRVVPAALILISLGGMMEMVGSTFWFPLLHDLVPEDRIGRFFGTMRTAWSTALFTAIVLIGAFLGRDPPLWKFQVVIGAGVALMLARNLFISRVPECRSAAVDADYSDWKRYVRDIISRREVLIFCGYFSALSFATGFLSTPLALYMAHRGFPARDNVLIFGCATLGQAMALIAAAVVTDRVGTKRVFLAAHLVLCAVAFGVVGIGWLPSSHAKALMAVALVVAGGMVAMAGVACTTQLFHMAPDRGRAFFLSLSMIAMVGGSALSPLLVGFARRRLAQDWGVTVAGVNLDFFQVFLAGAGGVMLLLIALLHFVQDVRRGETPAEAGKGTVRTAAGHRAGRSCTRS